MCGIFGAFGEMVGADAYPRFRRALDTMAHRGPDGTGEFIDPKGKVFFGHRRLSIIDPENGVQPMTTHDGRLTVVFNGAIYNYLELRRELCSKGHPIKSFCDTEVLLYAYREWGEACVDHFLGMFAFVIWDKETQSLFGARDRVGIKPFYYSFSESQFFFASEAKAIIAAQAQAVQPNHEAVLDYLTFQHCLGDKTLFAGIQKLEPGQTIKVQSEQGQLQKTIRTYWDLEFSLDDTHDEKWFTENLSVIIEDSIRLHLRSDVPLGTYLSGGLDSSVVTCLAARLLGNERIKTFTGTFAEGKAYDETVYAKAVASAVNADYHEILINGEDLPTLWPKLIHVMDEPMAGPGLIPQYHVSKMAAQSVKVALGGQGGDEIFAGYARYLVMYLEQCLSGAIWQTADDSKYAVSLSTIIPNLPLLQDYKPMMRSFFQEGMFDSADKRYFRLLDRSAGMRGLFSSDLWDGGYRPYESYAKLFNNKTQTSLLNKMLYFDLKSSLPALLHVEDRASMAASLESRVPLLDHRIIEFVASIPTNIKFKGANMKHIFKNSIGQTIPASILNRKDKMGFPTPLTHWTKGRHKDYVLDTLLSTKARNRGLYNHHEIEQAITSDHEFGRVIWGLMSLELWHQSFVDGGGVKV